MCGWICRRTNFIFSSTLSFVEFLSTLWTLLPDRTHAQLLPPCLFIGCFFRLESEDHSTYNNLIRETLQAGGVWNSELVKSDGDCQSEEKFHEIKWSQCFCKVWQSFQTKGPKNPARPLCYPSGNPLIPQHSQHQSLRFTKTERLCWYPHLKSLG